MCFAFVLATIIQFASVHFFTKHGSGEVLVDSDDDEEEEEAEEEPEPSVSHTSTNHGRTNIVRIYFSPC